MAVINNLTSTSTTDSLSANMGRELDERLVTAEFDIMDLMDDVSTINTDISSVESRIETLENNSSGGSQCNCEIKIWTEPVA